MMSRAAFLFLMATLSTPVSAEPAKQHALLIGINDYQTPEFVDLRGCVNDVDKVRGILASRFGFSLESIRVLKNAEATRVAILRELRALAKRVKENDNVYIHFSGHGSQVTDLNGDETEDGLDETLIPHDGRMPGVADIVDDEISDILATLKTERVLVVLDCCHSGTGTRSPYVQARAAPKDQRLELYKHLQTAKRGAVDIESKHRLLTGAAASQSALDGPVDGTMHGLFTYAFTRAVTQLDVAAKPRAVLERVVREYRRIQEQLGLFAIPSPQLELPKWAIDRPLFVATKRAARLPFAVISAVRKPGDVRLSGAVPLGAVVGARWAVYEKQESHFRPGRALAVGNIVRVDGSDAWLRLDSQKPNVRWMHRRAVALLPAPPSKAPTVGIEALTANQSTAVAAALAKDVGLRGGGVQLVKEGFARYHLQGTAKTGFQILGSDRRTEIARYSGKDWNAVAQHLSGLVTRSAAASDILSIDNLASEMQLSLSVVNVGQRGSTSEVLPKGVRVVAATAEPRYRVRYDNEPRTTENSLMVRVVSSHDAYLTVVDVDSEGNITQLFPTPHQKSGFYDDGFVTAGLDVQIPDGLQPKNEAGFYWDYTPPAGIDTIRVFAARDLAVAEMLRQRIQAASVVERGERQSHCKELRQLLGTVAARGVRVVAASEGPASGGSSGGGTSPSSPESFGDDVGAGGDWTASSITIVVEE